MSLSKDAFGLEITDTTVRVMKFALRGGKAVAVSAGLASIAPGIMKDGDIKDENGLVGAIKEAVGGLSGERIKTKRVVVSLPENKSFLQVIKMPKLRDEDLRAAVVFEAENYIPLPLEKVYLDYEIVPAASSQVDDGGCEVLIAAFPREAVDARVQAVVKAGLVPVAMELESQAAARVIFAGKISQPPTVIFQIGDDRTNLIVYSENSIRLTFSIPISNSYFLETIAQSAQVDMKEADVLKTKRGIEEFARMSDGNQTDDLSDSPQFGAEQRKIFEALVPGLVDLVQQAKKCLQYYQTHETGRGMSQAPIERILICGSGSDLLGLDEFIALKLNTRVERVSPQVCMKAVEGIASRQSLCGFAVAGGLAMRALYGDKLPSLNSPAAVIRGSARERINNAVGTASPKRNMSKPRRIKIGS
ncbi:MAG: type IV pilus assembly protein PilM [Candidatus Paceibacterota bacterium]